LKAFPIKAGTGLFVAAPGSGFDHGPYLRNDIRTIPSTVITIPAQRNLPTLSLRNIAERTAAKRGLVEESGDTMYICPSFKELMKKKALAAS
jgi:hypothetical protein